MSSGRTQLIEAVPQSPEARLVRPELLSGELPHENGATSSIRFWKLDYDCAEGVGQNYEEECGVRSALKAPGKSGAGQAELRVDAPA